jgi:hypothetical protein
MADLTLDQIIKSNRRAGIKMLIDELPLKLEERIKTLYKEPISDFGKTIAINSSGGGGEYLYFKKVIQSCLIDILSKINYYNKYKKYISDQLLETKKEISELKKTNEDILKKLDDQIKLNAKLCDRIFEMKEEKFKEGR